MPLVMVVLFFLSCVFAMARSTSGQDPFETVFHKRVALSSDQFMPLKETYASSRIVCNAICFTLYSETHCCYATVFHDTLAVNNCLCGTVNSTESLTTVAANTEVWMVDTSCGKNSLTEIQSNSTQMM